VNVIQGSVYLRPWILRDFTLEAAWAQDPEITELDPPAGKIFNVQKFSICTLSDRHIGLCMLFNKTQTEVELGIRIGEKDCWDKGYGKDAVDALVMYCFFTMNVDLVWLKVLPWNARAIKCYEKCGFVENGEITVGDYDFIRMERKRT